MILSRLKAFRGIAIPIVFFGGFATGFFACVNSRSLAKTAPRPFTGQPDGDASPVVRAGVLRSVESFQAGYTARDADKIEMQGLLDADSDTLIVGTDEPNWIRGYSDAVRFVQADWTRWGDLRLNLNNPVISSWQDVAWITTDGDVQFSESTRPVLFSAVLVHKGDKWLFRKMEFHWDERSRSSRELLHADLYLHALSVATRKIIGRSGDSPPPS